MLPSGDQQWLYCFDLLAHFGIIISKSIIMKTENFWLLTMHGNIIDKIISKLHDSLISNKKVYFHCIKKKL